MDICRVGFEQELPSLPEGRRGFTGEHGSPVKSHALKVQ